MESSPLYSAVAPVRPVAAYIGGKRNLARRHISLIETIPHRTYAEPFVGMGGVYLRRRYRPQAEVINDWSQDVATFYRVLQRHYVAFRDMLRFQLTTRAEFERLSRVDPSTLTDLERAARFLYLQRLAFGGKVAGRNFGVSHHRPGNFDVTKLGPMLEDLHDRLRALSEQALEIGQERLRFGRASNFEVLSLQADLRAADAQQLSANIAYLNALTALDQQIGSTLETWRISLND